jgi:hypothetical protein
MIHRAELERERTMNAKEQENILRRCADDYFRGLEDKHQRGSAIRQFVDNLGRFCEAETDRPNAPYAPGVNGFGLTPDQIVRAVGSDRPSREVLIFREVLTYAVAGNVLSVRLVNQGAAGTEKVVFYLNRLLCVRFKLPLSYGGWKHLPTDLLLRMMQGSVELGEMKRRGESARGPILLEETSSDNG